MLTAPILLSKMATPNRAVIIESGFLVHFGGSRDGNSLAGHSIRRPNAIAKPRICHGGSVDAGAWNWRELGNFQRGGCVTTATAAFSEFGPTGQYLADRCEPRDHERYDIAAGISRMARTAEILPRARGLESRLQVGRRCRTSRASLGRRSFIGIFADARRQTVSRQGFCSR